MLILIVYIGAISILFLFVIMLLNIREEVQFTSKVIKLVFFIIYCSSITWVINKMNTFDYYLAINDSPSLLFLTNFYNVNELSEPVYFHHISDNLVSDIEGKYKLIN